jgi:hypothetical protein
VVAFELGLEVLHELVGRGVLHQPHRHVLRVTRGAARVVGTTRGEGGEGQGQHEQAGA